MAGAGEGPQGFKWTVLPVLRMEHGTQGLYVFHKDILSYVEYISNVWKIRRAYVPSTLCATGLS